MSEEEEWVTVGTPVRRIISVEAAAGRTVVVTWEGNEIETIDLTAYISKHRVFERLRRDDAYFRGVKLDEYGWGITWDPEGRDAIPATGLDEAAGRPVIWPQD